jgi:hypothetical protein
MLEDIQYFQSMHFIKIGPQPKDSNTHYLPYILLEVVIRRVGSGGSGQVRVGTGWGQFTCYIFFRSLIDFDWIEVI